MFPLPATRFRSPRLAFRRPRRSSLDELSGERRCERRNSEGTTVERSGTGPGTKTVLTDIGPVDFELPRKAWELEPMIIASASGASRGDAMVCSFSANGLTLAEKIRSSGGPFCLQGPRVEGDDQRDHRRGHKGYGSVAEPTIQPGPARVFVDGIVVKIRKGEVANRPIYGAVVVTVDGSAKSWGSGPARAVRTPNIGSTS
jgi:putative transposase